jgi:hypothetical protein
VEPVLRCRAPPFEDYLADASGEKQHPRHLALQARVPNDLIGLRSAVEPLQRRIRVEAVQEQPGFFTNGRTERR